MNSAAHELLLRGDDAEVGMLLSNPCSSNLVYGFESMFSSHTNALRASSERRLMEAKAIELAVHRLAEALGASPIGNPEAPERMVPFNPDMEAVLKEIATLTGLTFYFPNPYPDEFGILLPNGIASMRAIFAIYQTHRIVTLLKLSSNQSVLEIGAGLGRTALYTFLNGCREYIIIDLPMINAVQAYFLGRILGEEHIVLNGETARFGAIRIYPPGMLNDLGPFGIVLNVDSLTEMDLQYATRYVAFARDKADVFFSINHEVNSFTTAQLIRNNAPGAVLFRYLHTLRPGYVEELAVTRCSSLIR
jgi:hypothetical protein